MYKCLPCDRIDLRSNIPLPDGRDRWHMLCQPMQVPSDIPLQRQGRLQICVYEHVLNDGSEKSRSG